MYRYAGKDILNGQYVFETLQKGIFVNAKI